eukprot:TRINITY_DN1148_c0_g1_i1.p1 TRINITY_DN1148_c0_g1~~TRINITY_DN1148_c0_g1_i1.p1  ORF type:complete len:945 (+),score=201.85 TRINITY_DN1148_c0_g1_i1:230-3064(+)
MKSRFESNSTAAEPDSTGSSGSSAWKPVPGKVRKVKRVGRPSGSLELARSLTEENLNRNESDLLARSMQHPPRDRLSMVDSPSLFARAQKSSLMHQKLATAKRQIDQEVRQLLPEVGTAVESVEIPEHREMLYSLRIEMAELLDLPEEVDKEKFYKIVGRLQSLQANRNKLRENPLPSNVGLLISKILFCTSRCARLLQYMDASDEQHDLNSTVKAFDSLNGSQQHASTSTATNRRCSVDTVPSWSDLNDGFGPATAPAPRRRSLDAQMPEDEMNLDHLSGMAEKMLPNKTTITSSLSSEDSLKADDSWGRTSFDDGQALQHLLQQIQRSTSHERLSEVEEVSAEELSPMADSPSYNQPGPPLLCRICECMVTRDRYKDHTQICLEVNSQEEALFGINQKLSQHVVALQPQLDTELAKLIQGHMLHVCGSIIDIEASSVIDDADLLGVHCSDLSQSLDDIAERIEEGMETQMELEQSYTGISNLLQEKRRSLSTLLDMRQRVEMTLPAPVNMPTPSRVMSPHRKNNRINEFDVLKPISHGAYGAVVLAKKKVTGDYFAIKKLKKSHMVRKKQVEHVMRERNILAATNNPFLVKMYYAFQSQNNLFVVMEFCQGGDLASMLQNLGAFSEEMTKAYTVELVLGLIYLSEQKIVHRDLKPDNILIGADGHIKVTDFGLSYGALVEHVVGEMDVIEQRGSEMKKAMQQEQQQLSGGRRSSMAKRYSEVGTPHYLAPEILTGMGHSYPVDYWALGIMMYEFLYGCPPFDGPDLSTIFYQITSCHIEWHDDVEISEEMRDLISKLLVVDPDQRLGSRSLEDMQGHPVFADVQWDTVLQSEAVFVPEPDDIEDVSYFNDKEDEEGVTRWSFDGLEADDLENLDDSYGNTPESPDPGLEASFGTKFLGFSFRNLSQLKNMNFEEIKLLESEGQGRSPLPRTPGGSTMRSSID